MPTHEIKVALPAAEVVNKDVTIQVKSGNGSLGRLEISRGSIDWWPANNTSNYFKMNWEKFADLMTTQGKAVNK